ncbi:MAG: hypothetical protein VR66_08180 [Peptococcaceae bacterium BRH_c23]|nr:MAG: hypothetical protein VR66_08180 [Peptococcaceae bacterium BRH_c23]KJS85223.1 MAG: hypothetical protein JL57_19485 [Desulfosporosinus sp. BICA1-9]HBW38346.1 hypothetical protein [Desulfosporosinus sp.]
MIVGYLKNERRKYYFVALFYLLIIAIRKRKHENRPLCSYVTGKVSCGTFKQEPMIEEWY